MSKIYKTRIVRHNDEEPFEYAYVEDDLPEDGGETFSFSEITEMLNLALKENEQTEK